jgi:hypothetical protein
VKYVYIIAALLLIAVAYRLDVVTNAPEQESEQELLVAKAKVKCGINAAWEVVDADHIQCMTHKGRKTYIADISK